MARPLPPLQGAALGEVGAERGLGEAGAEQDPVLAMLQDWPVHRRLRQMHARHQFLAWVLIEHQMHRKALGLKTSSWRRLHMWLDTSCATDQKSAQPQRATDCNPVRGDERSLDVRYGF
jgi:hypothetical protein